MFRSTLFILLAFLSVPVARAGITPALPAPAIDQENPPPESQTDLGGRVAALFESRCSVCHGEGSKVRKAQRAWPDATDLIATAADPELVVPGSVEDSDLYAVIDFEEMPPEDSDQPPLTEAERALVSEWIAAGAPPPERAAAAPHSEAGTAATPGGSEQDGAKHVAGWSRILRWIGHHHPIIVHFPIALLLAAFLAELLARFSGRIELESASLYCLVLGVLSALPSALLGLILASYSGRHGSDLELHRWLGISVALGSLLVLWGSLKRPRWRLALLAILGVIVGLTGHTGGILSYGPDWLSLPF